VLSVDLVVERAAGLDVHKATVVATVHTPAGRATRTFGTVTAALQGLAGWLRGQGVTHVAMESTGVFWRPIYNLLEAEEAFALLVVNAQHVKQVPGRKTDVRDAEWLCDLLRHGLLRASFIPDKEQRERRELVRYRKTLVRERASEVNRIQKVLEGANIKLASVATDVLGVSGRRMLEALVAGAADAPALADLAKGRLRRKRAALEEALTGRVGPHQRFLLREQLAHLDELDARIARVSAELEARLRPFAAALAALQTIPGVGRGTAEAIVCELGADLRRFPTAGHLASWAGLCPGQHESAGKRASGRTRKGNPWLRAALVEAAWAAAHTKASYLRAQYHRLAARRGAKRAVVAVAHTLLVIIYHVLTTGEVYRDLGADYFDRRDRDALARRLVKRLTTLGYAIALEAPPV
jgi:transposase